MKTIYWVFSDIKRNKGYLAFFIFSFACALIMLSMIFSQFVYAKGNDKIIKQLNNQNIYAFHVTYTDENELNYTNHSFQLEELDNNKAYSVIVKQGLNNSMPPYLYIIGNNQIVSHYFNGYVPASYDVWIDEKLKNKINKDTLHKDGIFANQILTLQENQWLPSKMDISLLLNDYIVIFQKYEDVRILDFSTDELINQMLMFEDEKMTSKFVEGFNQSKELKIEKYNFIEKKKNETNSLSTDSIFYSVLFGTYLLVFIIMLSVNNDILTEMKVKEYATHLVYGATKKNIYLRIILYNATIIGLSILCYFILNSLYHFSKYQFLYVFILGLCSWIVLSILPMIRLNRKNLFDNMRGDIS